MTVLNPAELSARFDDTRVTGLGLPHPDRLVRMCHSGRQVLATQWELCELPSDVDVSLRRRRTSLMAET